MIKIKFTDVENSNFSENNFKIWLINNKQNSKSIKCFWELIIKPALNDNLENVETAAALSVIKRSFLEKNRLYFGIPKTNLSSLWAPIEKIIERSSSRILKKTNVKNLISSKGKLIGIKLSNGDVIKADNFIISASQSATINLLKNSNIENNSTPLETAPILGIHFWFKKPVIK